MSKDRLGSLRSTGPPAGLATRNSELVGGTYSALYTDGLINGLPIPNINLLLETITSNSSLVTCPLVFTPSGRGTSPVATLSTSNPVKFGALDQKVEGTLDQGSWK
jgi:hypothetical protein